MTSQLSDMTLSSKFLWRCLFYLKFSCWSKFSVNIITDFWILTIFVYKELTQNRKSELPASNSCQISGDWGELGISVLARMSRMKCYWMLQIDTVIFFSNFGVKLHHPLLWLDLSYSMNRIKSKNHNIKKLWTQQNFFVLLWWLNLCYW